MYTPVAANGAVVDTVCAGLVLQTDVITTHPDMPIANILPHFETVSMLPVVLRGDGRLVGVVARSDVQRKSGMLVQDVMTRPPIAAQSHNKIHDAAVIMHKVSAVVWHMSILMSKLWFVCSKVLSKCSRE